ncbi:sigma-54 dependent transcriptional regulator [Marinobacterium sediminicola]|uniref:DNA-binding transcriptional response regulator, NtrC family, contains REC, AAA-type ATPase, and a Fis-type DNA-binding domains n=1 Tax=Marinobacterium sediminicola TaxID=518898 RepID=A0ABY1S0J0_9GAMM|nr:sigma-54 dependent transcriptional regulator [Marinobacterium sediminicola]ULG68411.1 sigma-54 dependent transcriptional regulator [Marinobacterium sediminicola]SMR74709.1 DNA-binding transcriptional response regulator, NtrC family, contains REC, AAA-type ATPase, and a Fis-type DNA-binding domains [Marinobacterium sediminicola]
MNTHDTKERKYPETERPLILIDLSSRPHPELSPASLQGWRLYKTESLSEAESLLQAEPFIVGLACFDWSERSNNEALIHFFQQHHQIAWIAAIWPEQLQDVSLRRMLFENFYDYCSLPLGNNIDHLAIILGHAYGLYHLQHLESRKLDDDNPFEMVGSSPQMLDIFEQIRKVAQTDATVLITGESGTGKELIARAIHQRSNRQEHPFIAVNCGALPESLIQSELFGYEKGAFTGASQRRLGRIEAAHQGSLFLDEVGDLAANLQAHLLRFLQEGTIERLGSNQSLEIDTRVIAATNIDLEKAVKEGRFREDLFYRLSVLNIKVPPLRDRGEDKELLARFFFNKFASDQKGQLKGFTQEAIDAINRHAWPGNVREMINRVRRGMIMSDNQMITPQDLNLESSMLLPQAASQEALKTLEEARAEAERVVIEHTLSQCHHNVSKAAKVLEVSRVTLYRMMEKHHLQHHKESPQH